MGGSDELENKFDCNSWNNEGSVLCLRILVLFPVQLIVSN